MMMKKFCLMFLILMLFFITITSGGAEKISIGEENDEIIIYDINPNQEIVNYLSRYGISHDPTGRLRGDFRIESEDDGVTKVVVYYDHEQKIGLRKLSSLLDRHFFEEYGIGDIIREASRLSDALKKFEVIFIENEIAKEYGASFKIVENLQFRTVADFSSFDIVSGEIEVECTLNYEAYVAGIIDYYTENWKIGICDCKVIFDNKEKRTIIAEREDGVIVGYLKSYASRDLQIAKYIPLGGKVLNRNRVIYYTKKKWEEGQIIDVISKIEGRYKLLVYNSIKEDFEEKGIYNNKIDIFTLEMSCVYPTKEREGYVEYPMSFQKEGKEYFSLDSNPNLYCEIEPVGEGIIYEPLNKPSEREIYHIITLIKKQLEGQKVGIPEYARGTDIKTTSENVIVKKRFTKEEILKEIKIT